jgi:two-component system, OmpR family, alkaline phosphatase synthesis response regulator PhoP
MKPLRILVADDDEAMVAHLTASLRPAGYEVEGAVNGAEAIVKLLTRRFDLLILDLMMPWMDGFKVLQAMRERMPERPMTLVLMPLAPLVEVNERLRAEVLDLGADQVIPWRKRNPSDHVAVVEELLSSAALKTP